MAIDINNLSPQRRVEDRSSSKPAGETQASSTAGKSRADRGASNDNSSTNNDSVELSDGAKTLGALTASAHQVSGVDQTKVDSIREQIAAGQYHVDPDRLAEKFLELEQELSG